MLGTQDLQGSPATTTDFSWRDYSDLSIEDYQRKHSILKDSPLSLLFRGNFCALLSCFREADSDRLLPAFHAPSSARFPRAQRAVLSPPHRAPH
jgi:hypothetical protein